MPDRGLSCGGLVAANSGEDKVDWESRPSFKHQIVWTVTSNCRSGGIISMHYFSQMRWPVSFLVFSQLSNYVHNHLVQSLYQPVSLGVVGCDLQSFMPRILHISSITLLVNLAPLSLKSLAGAPKIEMYPPYKNLATVFTVWSGVMYANMCFMKWSWNTKMLASLGDWFGSNMVSMLVKSTCRISRGAEPLWGIEGPCGSHPHTEGSVCRP